MKYHWTDEYRRFIWRVCICCGRPVVGESRCARSYCPHCGRYGAWAVGVGGFKPEGVLVVVDEE